LPLTTIAEIAPNARFISDPRISEVVLGLGISVMPVWLDFQKGRATQFSLGKHRMHHVKQLVALHLGLDLRPSRVIFANF
jgi:hypothetical protein